MSPEQFNAAEPLLDAVTEEVDKLLGGADAEPLRKLLIDLSAKLSGSLGVSLRVELNVADWERERVLSLLQTGISVADGSTYVPQDDCSLHRYLVEGNISVVPHDRCPGCWSNWGFKLKNRDCPSCQLVLGEGVRLLLDSDVCPFCEKGTVTSNEPVCDRCGFQVDEKIVSWG